MPERGEVWQVDFGITQKVRPALVISVPYGDADRALIGVIPHTRATRGSQFEVSVTWLSLRHGPAGDPSGSPGRLKIEAARDAVDVQQFTGKVQPGTNPALHRPKIHLAQ